MFDLASLKYRHARAEEGGPIARITSAPVSIYGRNIYQADAFLAPGFGSGKPLFEQTTEADGTGSGPSDEQARHRAVSEAIEQWALQTEYEGPQAARYGLTPEHATRGMAAYPGFFRFQARARAHLEALELLAVVSWWSGRIDASPFPSLHPGIGALRLHHSAGFGEVVIVHRLSRSGHASYGYAAGETLAAALNRALVHLARCEQTITRHKIMARSQPISGYRERRCLHFASPDGHREFLDRLEAGPDKPAPKWAPFFDGEIKGPWSHYATVWRTVLHMPTGDFVDPRLNFFYW